MPLNQYGDAEESRMEPQKILKKIYRFEQGQQKRLNNLYEAYIGKYKIMQAVKKDGKPNNKLINNFAHKIVNDTVVSWRADTL